MSLAASPTPPTSFGSSMARPSSRASSRGSMIRSPSPMDDQVSLRGQMSSLKHEIRVKQAQFNTLETNLLRGPRPLPPSPTELYVPIPSTSQSKRNSLEILSSSPSNRNIHEHMNGHVHLQEDIKEGVPSSFGSISSPSKRSGSPTRTLSRIPVSSVGLARTLAEEPSNSSRDKDMSYDELLPPLNIADTTTTSSFMSIPSPRSSNPNRKSLAPGGTTKVLADLQAGVMNARNALENTKTQLRLSQRTVAQLTRQVEDMRDGRERLRLENEGLNNVVARKERLLQEVLERARKAEAEAQQLKGQLKTETTNTKKTMRELESQVSESTALSQRSEREYLTLKDSIKGLSDQWQKDVEQLKLDFKTREESWRTQIEDSGVKYRSLMKLMQSTQAERARIEQLKAEKQKLDSEFEKQFRTELSELSAAIKSTTEETRVSTQETENVKEELDRIHRLIRTRAQFSSET